MVFFGLFFVGDIPNSQLLALDDLLVGVPAFGAFVIGLGRVIHVPATATKSFRFQIVDIEDGTFEPGAFTDFVVVHTYVFRNDTGQRADVQRDAFDLLDAPLGSRLVSRADEVLNDRQFMHREFPFQGVL